MNVKFTKLHPNAAIPTYATDGSACFDLRILDADGCSCAGETIKHDDPVLCRTGLAFEIPADHVMLLFSRSGHAFKRGIRLANCVGVIDSDYRGEVMVKLAKDDDWHDHIEGAPIDRVFPGERIAQAMILRLPEVVLVEVDELSSTERGTGGFGSTGV
jgi:dUTP pyrophosphatase